MPEVHHRILLPGVPVSSRRGALGWCSVVLVRAGGRNILFDTGSYGDRAVLLDRLAAAGLAPRDVDLVFASHFHFDHVANAEVFDCDVALSERERRYALEAEYLAANDPFVPRALVPFLSGRLQPARDGDHVAPGVRAVALPGHTPGTMGLLLEEDAVLLTGDAVKNAWDFVRGEPPPAFHSAATAPENYRKIREIARTVVPGHDRPFHVLADGGIAYAASAEVALDLYADPRGPATPVRLLG
ncbi:MAG TPA: MBL fold metallo-hydrolase [Anaeromyxobacteraceae bacterium]|nr:MBL fold metallo-hydrolase [Anaeromyxobacteraceae bacterium]